MADTPAGTTTSATATPGAASTTATTTPTTTTDTQATATATYSQAQLDQAISKALATREANLKTEIESKSQAAIRAAEDAKLAAEGKFKDLYERAEAQRSALELDQKTISELTTSGDIALLAAVKAAGNTIEARLAARDSIKATIAAQVQAAVAEKLKTPGTPTGGAGTAKTPDKMTPAEYSQWKASNGIR